MSQGKHWFGEGQYKIVLHFRTGVLRLKVDLNPSVIRINQLKMLAEQYAYDFKEFKVLTF